MATTRKAKTTKRKTTATKKKKVSAAKLKSLMKGGGIPGRPLYGDPLSPFGGWDRRFFGDVSRSRRPSGPARGPSGFSSRSPSGPSGGSGANRARAGKGKTV
jgi:hypothetical protein